MIGCNIIKGEKQMKNSWYKKTLVFGIIVLFIGFNFRPITGSLSNKTNVNSAIATEDISTNLAPFTRMSNSLTGIKLISLESQSNSGNIAQLTAGITMYGYNTIASPHGKGPCKFDVEKPDNIVQISNQVIPTFASGGTWTCDGKWLVCTYGYGWLFEIDPETGEITEIGGGGIGLNGLAFDPTTNLLYGASGNGATGGLWKIDPDTGEQEYIGDFENSVWIIGIAFDVEGVLYGWDISPDYLYTIDKETGKATPVGSLGINLNYAQDGAFDMENDILYLTTFTLSPEYGGFLYKCDEDTGGCTLVGAFENNAEIDATMIKYTCVPPEHDVGVKSIIKPTDGYDLPNIIPQITVKNWGNNSENTDVQFEIIKCENGPTLLSEDFITWPPAGWEYNGYYQSYTNKAGGIPPEAAYRYYPNYVSFGYIMSPPINAKGFEKINVKFHLLGDFAGYSGTYFYLQYRKNASSPWLDVTPWDNPVIADLIPTYYEIGCNGWGENIGDSFQVRWYFDNYYYYLQYGSGIYLDDVEIHGCAGCAEYAELAEDVQIPVGQEVDVEFPSWTPSEWHNESYQNTWEDYPITAYTLLDDNNSRNNMKQRLLHLYYPWLHDVGTFTFEGPTSGPAQTFPVKTTIKNVGQYDECCLKVYAQIAELDMDNSYQLFTQSFDSCYPWPPEGWTTTYPSNWQCWYSNYAGGTSPELVFTWYPSQIANFRFKSPPINTSGYGAVQIQFKHAIQHYDSPYKFRVETSPNGISWSTAWEIENPKSHRSQTETIVTSNNVGSDTFYVSLTFSGNSYNINYWFIDDIVINGYPLAEPEYTDFYCIETLEVGEEKLITFNDWTPDYLQYETTGTKRYACKVWTDFLEYEDYNHANDAYATSIKLEYFHDVSIQVSSPIEGIGSKIVWDNGDTDGSNGYSFLSSLPRLLLDDFELIQTTKISEMHLFILAPYGIPNDFEVKFRKDNNKRPGDIIGTSNDVSFSIKTTDRYWFGYQEYQIIYGFEPIKLTKGIYWFEGCTKTSSSNCFWMTRLDILREECWINYAEYGGLYPSSYNFGFQADLSYQLWGQAGAHAYVPIGTKNIDGIASNVGTFPENDIICYAKIYEFYSDCENGTLVYENNITNIDILEPLTGTELLNFIDYNFAVEGLYHLDLKIVDDNDDNPNNNQLEWMIGCDATPPATTYTLSPSTPDGLNDWYISDVEVTLIGTDPSISCEIYGSGVQEIKYQIDGGAVQTLPGTKGKFRVTTDSTMHTIKYWAIDKVGKTESQKTIQFKQDQTPPVIDFTYEWSGDEPPYTFTFTAYATDATSVMERVEFYRSGELQETVYGPGPVYVWEIIYIPSPYDRFRAYAYDFAGLSAYDDIIDPCNMDIFKSTISSIDIVEGQNNHQNTKNIIPKIEIRSPSQYSSGQLFIRFSEKFSLFEQLLDILGVYQK